MTVRTLFLKTHLYLAFAAGVPLVLIGVTGSLLVIGEELDLAARPGLFYVEPQGERVPLESILGAVESAHPEARPAGFGIGLDPGRSHTVTLLNRLQVHVDPYSGRVLGANRQSETWRRTLYLWHVGLVAGKPGHWFVVASTAVAVFLVATGLVLWWRSKTVTVSFRSWRKTNLDLHSVAGMVASAVLLVLAVTGLAITFEHELEQAARRLAGGGASAPAPGPKAPGSGRAVSLDAVVEAANRALPEALTTFVALPIGPKGVFRVYKKFPEDPTTLGRSRVVVDPADGGVLGVDSYRQAPRLLRGLNFVEPIHFGDVYGAPTRIVAFAGSLVLPLLAVTGLLIWWRPRRA
jgi:uncharacterized iron-regulated membrane protein